MTRSSAGVTTCCSAANMAFSPSSISRHYLR
ncbi:hypothetical protein LTSEUGA_5560, partial [Salmonella enterica subsp. enterica serovar Uganda str. R8-3404]